MICEPVSSERSPSPVAARVSGSPVRRSSPQWLRPDWSENRLSGAGVSSIPGSVVQSVAYDSQGRAYIGESGRRVIRHGRRRFGRPQLERQTAAGGEDEGQPVDIAIDDEQRLRPSTRSNRWSGSTRQTAPLLDQWSAAVPCCRLTSRHHRGSRFGFRDQRLRRFTATAIRGPAGQLEV